MLLALTWGLIGLLIGPLIVLLAPVVIAWVGGDELRETVGDLWITRAIKMWGSSALVAKEQGGVAIASTSTDEKIEGDVVTVNGESGHLKDRMDVKGHLKGEQFGVATDILPVYVTPLIAEMGDRATDALERDRLGVQPDGGVRLDFELPERPQVPDLRNARHIVEGSTGFRDAVVAEDWARKSQQKFHERMSLSQTLLLMAAFAVGVGLAIAVSRLGGGGGGGGVEVPIQIAVTTVGVIA